MNRLLRVCDKLSRSVQPRRVILSVCTGHRNISTTTSSSRLNHGHNYGAVTGHNASFKVHSFGNDVLGVRHNYVQLTVRRSYSKKKDKIKESKKSAHFKHNPKVSLSPDEYDDVIDLEQMKQAMERVLDDLKVEYSRQLSLRTSIGSFSSLIVDVGDGTRYPLNQVAQVIQKSPQLIVVNASAFQQHISEVKKAITDSGLNVNPQQDGSTLFITIPKVTMEHREGLAKNAKTLCHHSKERLRSIQNKYIKTMKKAKPDHSEDLLRNLNELILSVTHGYNETAEKLMRSKQEELLRVK